MVTLEGAKFIVTRSMHGITRNIYFGLDDYEEVRFAQRFLKAGDYVVDCGANVGFYATVLSAIPGVEVLAIEPDEATFEVLQANLRLNARSERVHALRFAVGAIEEDVNLSVGRGPQNRVVKEGEVGTMQRVRMMRLDSLTKRRPTLLKVDVEGYELDVLRGGCELLGNDGCQALIVELGTNSLEYGIRAVEVADFLEKRGFSPFRYDVASNRLEEDRLVGRGRWNQIFINDKAAAERRMLGLHAE